MTEEQLIAKFVEQHPGLVEELVSKAITRFVEERIELWRDEVDEAIRKGIERVATGEFTELFLVSQGDKKNLAEVARHEARNKIAEIMSGYWAEIGDVKTYLGKLRRSVERIEETLPEKASE